MSDEDVRTNVLNPEQEARAEALMAARRALMESGFASGKIGSGYELVQVANWIVTGQHFTLSLESIEKKPEADFNAEASILNDETKTEEEPW